MSHKELRQHTVWTKSIDHSDVLFDLIWSIVHMYKIKIFLQTVNEVPIFIITNICDVTGLLLKNVIERNLWIKTVFNPEFLNSWIPELLNYLQCENLKILYSEKIGNK